MEEEPDQPPQLTEQVIGLAIEVHRQLGPGLLESTYEACLAHELKTAALPFARQVALPVTYKDVKLECGYRIDFVIAGELIVEVKAVEKLTPLHDAQLLTYLRLSRIKTGLLMNFNTPALRHGLKRLSV